MQSPQTHNASTKPGAALREWLARNDARIARLLANEDRNDRRDPRSPRSN